MMNIYHVFTKSIAGFQIFREDKDFQRIIELLSYYKDNPLIKFSDYKKLKNKFKHTLLKNTSSLIQIIAYCIMPTHIHLVLYEKRENGISDYMRRLLNSYTRYFVLVQRELEFSHSKISYTSECSFRACFCFLRLIFLSCLAS